MPVDGGDPDKTSGHASGPSAEAKRLKRERIDHIVGLMERCEWVRGDSAEDLAEIWGVAVKTVEGYSAEAHRRIVGDPDEARRDITVGARKLLQEAVSASDFNGFSQVGRLWAEVSGAKAVEKRELTARVAAVGLDDLDALKAAALANEECPTTTEPNDPSSSPGR